MYSIDFIEQFFLTYNDKIIEKFKELYSDKINDEWNSKLDEISCTGKREKGKGKCGWAFPNGPCSIREDPWTKSYEKKS